MILNRTSFCGHVVFRRPAFGLRDWWEVLRQLSVLIGEKRLSLMSAGVAFFAMLALFPAIAASIALFGIVADPVVVQQGLDLLEPLLPDDVYRLINLQVAAVVYAPRQTLGFTSAFSVLLATFGARAGVNAILTGLSAIAPDNTQRGYVRAMVVAYGMTLLLILVTLLSVGVVVVLPTVFSFFPLGEGTAQIVNILRWASAVLAVLIGVGVLYRYAPCKPTRRTPLITYGNLVAAALWVVVSLGFSLYLGNFANYNQVYGSLGAVIALLMWFYLSALTVLIGAALNAAVNARACELFLARLPLARKSAESQG